MNKNFTNATIKDDYNNWAEKYDTVQNKTRDLDVKATKETLNKYHFKTVIEIRCGTGKNTGFLLEKADKILAMDFSEKMLSIAKNKVVDERVIFSNVDITKKWNIENDFADLITSNLVLEHIKDLDHIFKQANMKLKKNGLFFLSELHPAKQYSGSKAKYENQGGTKELLTYTHHISDYINALGRNGFKLVELNEWFDNQKVNEIPRLISFVFQK